MNTTTSTARRLVVMLHGHDDDPATFADWARYVSPPGYASAAPVGPLATPNGASWFASDDYGDPSPSDVRASLDLIDETIDRLAAEQGFPREGIVLGGFSQGAAMVWLWALSSEGPDAGVAHRSIGGLFTIAGWLPEVDGIALDPAACRAPRMLIGHGEDDDVVPLPLGRGPARLVERQGVEVSYEIRPVGHDLAPFVDPIREWIAGLAPSLGISPAS